MSTAGDGYPGRPLAISSALRNVRSGGSSWAAAVDLPAPLGPAITKIVGIAINGRSIEISGGQRVAESVGQAVDLGLGAFLGDGNQDHVGEVGVPAAEGDPAVEAEAADLGQHLVGVLGRADD